MNDSILVYGFYGKNNLGDDLFIDSFKKIFPDLNLIFTSIITPDLLKDVSAVFFGGGSFLYDHPNISTKDLDLLKQKKIFYIGIGIEADIHPCHIDLMSSAELIATRSLEQLDRVKSINCNAIYIPDIVYSLRHLVSKISKKTPSVLVLPNISVVPKHKDPYWKHASWNYFKSEFCQFLDLLVSHNKCKLNFFAMCQNKDLDDSFAAAEIINCMTARNNTYILDEVNDFSEITKTFSQYDVIITQRFHGIVIADMVGVPFIAIHHHDKIKNAQSINGKFVSYYGLTKSNLTEEYLSVKNMDILNILPIESNTFERLNQTVTSLLK